MKHLCVLGTLALVLVAAHAPAHANDGFAEIVLGISEPVGDDDYERAIDTSPKIGVRLGAMGGNYGGTRLGFDIGVDWRPLQHDFNDTSLHRVGITGALRAVYPINAAAVVFRLGAGIDYARWHTDTSFLGVPIEATETDIGLLLDPSMGIMFDIGGGRLGFQLGLPFAFHNDDDGDDFDFDYESVDLDLMLAFSSSF